MINLKDTDQAPYSALTATVSDAAVQAATKEYIGYTLAHGQYAYPITGMRNALTAALPHLNAPCSVEVTKLDWREPCRDTNMCWTAKSIFGTFSVVNEDGWYACCEDSTVWEWEPENDTRSYLDEYAAQQACQDWHDRRILSAIVTKPVDVAAVRKGSAIAENSLQWIVDHPRESNAAVWAVAHDALSAIRALSPAESAQQWQPIETAPKDGTTIWVLDELYRKPWHYECCWSGIQWYHGFGTAWPTPRPTHWMPLPAAPLPAGRTTEGGEA